MPDIVSRIKLEAQGADQAAREIRKLKAAYDDVAGSARNLSPIAGGGDPFTAATRAGGLSGGGADIVDREYRSATARQEIQKREDANKSYDAVQRNQGRGLVSGIQAGTGVMDQIGQSNMVGAASSGLSSLGAFMGNPVGMGLMAAGAVAMGVNKLAGNEYERVQQIWGSGQSQRLGRSYDDIKNWQKEMGVEGIPLERVLEFTSTASQTGFNANEWGASQSAANAMEAAADMGLAPTQAATLLGTLSRTGVGHEYSSDRGMYSAGVEAFGPQNLGRLFQALTQSIEGLAQKGINISNESFREMNGVLTSMVGFGGMTGTEAIAAYNTIQQRGISAAQMQKPEDVIAMNLMRKPGMSIQDTTVAMEEQPVEVARTMYDYWKGTYGEGSDEMFLKMREYLGGTASQTQDVLKFFSSVEGMSYDDMLKEMESRGWADIKDLGAKSTRAKEGDIDPRDAVAAKQLKLLSSLEESALRLTTEITGLLTGEKELNALNIKFGGDAITLNVAKLQGDSGLSRQEKAAIGRGFYGDTSGKPIDEEVSALSYGRMAVEEGWVTSTDMEGIVDREAINASMAINYALKANTLDRVALELDPDVNKEQAIEISKARDEISALLSNNQAIAPNLVLTDEFMDKFLGANRTLEAEEVIPLLEALREIRDNAQGIKEELNKPEPVYTDESNGDPARGPSVGPRYGGGY